MDYRKKGELFQAIQWNGANWTEVDNFFGTIPYEIYVKAACIVFGNSTVKIGEYVVKSITNEFCVCTKESFESTYEGVS